MAESVVLDTSACFALLEDEGGADVVEKHLVDARSGHVDIHGSFVTLTEVEYITMQERGEEDAARALASLKAWPVTWHHSGDAICSAAAKLKAAHKVSFADSFVASLAQDLDATLIHKDPEFLALSGMVKQKMLPPK
ncbi:PIN domain-containing protein [Prosthecobacter sp.]|uniref:PIN domain-containing protein n=1 Tax=Prosthecobacter sp. TaxID=1965333 RepID=UPI003782D2A7